MTQPPPGQFPPPGQPGPNPGAVPPPGGYPPPGAVPPPAQGFAGAPGYPPQGAAPGYPPQGQQYGAPQGYPTPPKSSFDPKSVGNLGWAIIGAGVLALVASFFNFWSVTSRTAYGSYSAGASGWSLWWWIPTLIALAIAAVHLLSLLGVLQPGQIKSEWLFYGAAAALLLTIFVLIHTFSYGGFSSIYDDFGISSGPGFGVFFSLVVMIVLTYLTLINAQVSGGKVPFKLPVPSFLAGGGRPPAGPQFPPAGPPTGNPYGQQ